MCSRMWCKQLIHVNSQRHQSSRRRFAATFVTKFLGGNLRYQIPRRKPSLKKSKFAENLRYQIRSSVTLKPLLLPYSNDLFSDIRCRSEQLPVRQHDRGSDLDLSEPAGSIHRRGSGRRHEVHKVLIFQPALLDYSGYGPKVSVITRLIAGSRNMVARGN